jgi:uncharacterized protein (DUF924 family)
VTARHRFSALLQAVRSGDCDEWELEGADHVAAMALALDQVRMKTTLLAIAQQAGHHATIQLSRKMALGAREAYANDAAAQALARALVDGGLDATLGVPLQLLLALPLLHAERVSDQ